MREIKFRAWNSNKKHFYYLELQHPSSGLRATIGSITDLDPWEQYTGLKDRYGDVEIYEGDIISAEGNVIGNQHETPALLEESINLHVQGFGTKNWLTTYQEAVDRGCHDA